MAGQMHVECYGNIITFKNKKHLIIENNTGCSGNIDISHLQSGVYIAKVYFEFVLKPFKIIKL
jgi:hypothetical protein